MTVSGGTEDKKGTDGYGFGLFGEDRVQIKYDQRIAASGNIYHELYEKTKGNPSQLWRASPHAAKWYIFTTVGLAWLVATDDSDKRYINGVLNPIGRNRTIRRGTERA